MGVQLTHIMIYDQQNSENKEILHQRHSILLFRYMYMYMYLLYQGVYILQIASPVSHD